MTVERAYAPPRWGSCRRETTTEGAMAEPAKDRLMRHFFNVARAPLPRASLAALPIEGRATP